MTRYLVRIKFKDGFVEWLPARKRSMLEAWQFIHDANKGVGNLIESISVSVADD